MALRACNKHGIYERVGITNGCPRCKADTAKVYDKVKRDSQLNTFYQGKAWKDVRVKQLKAYPLCIECKREAKIVDHVKEIRDGGAKYAMDNLQSMCVSCHNSKTARERKERG